MRITDISSLPENHPIKKKLREEGMTAPKGPRNQDEHHLQTDAVDLFRLKYPEHKKRLFAIPNGGARNGFVGKKLKDEGVLAGVWDLFLAVPSGKWSGCFIETKISGNTLSDTQQEFSVANCDHYYFFVYQSINEFEHKIEKYLQL